MLIFSGVYLIRNSINGKGYVGFSCNLARRFKVHISQLNQGTHHSVVLQRAWNKYGETAFQFLVLTFIEGKEFLFRAEQEWTTILQSDDGHHGYNMRKVGRSSAGMEFSDETRNKMSASKKGRRFSEEHRRHLGEAQLGRRFSPERCARMSEARKGKRRSPEHVQNAANAQRGLKRSPEARARISEGVRRDWETRSREMSDEQKIKLGIASRRWWGSPEERRKQSERSTGRVHSSEARAKISEGNRRAWAEGRWSR